MLRQHKQIPAYIALLIAMAACNKTEVPDAQITGEPSSVSSATRESTPYDLGPFEKSEAQGRSTYHIKSPTYIPEGLEDVGWRIREGKALIFKQYFLPVGTTPRTDQLQTHLVINQIEGTRFNPASAFSEWSQSRIETITISGVEATLVHGIYYIDGQGGEDDISKTIVWKQDGLTYYMVAERIDISLEEMIRLAESME
jgi:hypothetical protein